MSYFERLTNGEPVNYNDKSQTFTAPRDNGTRGRKQKWEKYSAEQEYNHEYGDRNTVKKGARKLKTDS